ncbi:MAG TPA: hypothetical protein VGI74_26165 [Streptosporangiaceae bacterium]
MTVPADYNAVNLSMTPSEISQTSMALQLAVEEVVSSLEVINTTLSDLALGWAGSTATEAKDFIDQWLAAMTNLFGSDKGATQGVLNQVMTILANAAGNYSSAEQSVVSMFSALSSALTSAPGGSDTAPIPAGTPVTDGSLSAVGESNWTALG